ncbi:UDP-N-acetylglucosamine 1-carboxyvinyltransferase [bacterium]|nr:UDP-N-acetylglucosamine 1-carboxyvinyltransferase [bacterium]
MKDKDNEFFVIKGLGGKKTLSGEIAVNGAKNEALPAMAASLLFRGELAISNVPEIEDIARMGELLEGIGMKVEREGSNTVITPGKNISSTIPDAISKRFRASIVATGPLLARTGKVSFPHPGGCVIGARPIDLFLEGYKKMGASVEETDHAYEIQAPKGLVGAEIFFRNQSVTATETFIMAAVLANGKTVLRNAALEPEVEHLAKYLKICGAKIKGEGTPTIEITGTKLLSSRGEKYAIIPDRIEAASFLLLSALAGKDVTVTHCVPEHLGALLEALEYSGIKMEIGKTSVRVLGERYKNGDIMPMNIKTHEYPGFPTDIQAPMTVFLTQASGESIVFETIFEGRLNYAAELIRMGANILPMDTNRIIIKGQTPLSGKNLESPDIRAGLAYIIAGIISEGETVIHNIYLIDRGYAKIEERLRSIGVKIERRSHEA